jgi:glycyl-tRNA synthetase
MTHPLSFQDIILRLHHYWAEHGCLIWQPYNVQVGAGTMNPATVLRVLGPEPWNVGYIEPSVRPDDSRYGENPNRVQQHIQYQVILKPDPGNPQDLYLGSLAAIGIDRAKHDIRFVEDNWESPALGAWGLGWEVWLDGLEITQFTYFQQAGGFMLDPVAVELTYGLERIAMFLQGVDHFKEIRYAPGILYGEMYGIAEYEHSRYNLDDANIEAQAELFRLYEQEAQRSIDLGLVLPAHEFVLKCSHTFNILDARGAVGVTERAKYFARMRELARQVSQAFLEQRQRLEFPLLDETGAVTVLEAPAATGLAFAQEPSTFVLEIGSEELPPGDASNAIRQLEAALPALLKDLRLDHGPIYVYGTPRRLTVLVEALAPRQRDEEELIKGPPAHVAFDESGAPTKAALGFARSRGLDVSCLQVREMDGGQYAAGIVRRTGRPTGEVLSEVLADLISRISFQKSMRWNASGVSFSRPIRWLVALLGDQVVPFTYAGLVSGRTTRGLRPDGSPEIEIDSAASYLDALSQANILLDQDARRDAIRKQIEALAAQVGGEVPDDPGLLEEVTYLVERPTALLGRFEKEYLDLPRELLVMVMRKHQRYFPTVRKSGTHASGKSAVGDSGLGARIPESTDPQASALLPYFIAVRNGGDAHMDIVRHGNQEVIRARFTDAEFFWKADTKKRLEDFLPRLNTLTFQEQLGSMLDKTQRLESLVPKLCAMLNLSQPETHIAQRAAHLCKADLVTQMVIDFTALQGIMGREYALLSGESPAVAQAIFEHYLPRHAGDAAPSARPGLVVGLANRLDSLAGLFAVGLAPSGSADPYHSRRDALGLVHNLIAHRQSFSVRDGLAVAAELMPVTVSDTALDETAAFVRERLRGVLRDAGFAFDVVDAVLSDHLGDDPYRARVAVEQLAAWVARDDWSQILAAYSRCVRILRTQPEGLRLEQPDPERFAEPATHALHVAYLQTADRVSRDASLDELFTAFLPLVEPITEFFDQVLVMAEEEALRVNRLALLQRIVDLTKGRVDLSKLQGF